MCLEIVYLCTLTMSSRTAFAVVVDYDQTTGIVSSDLCYTPSDV